MEGKTIQQILDQTSRVLFGFDNFNRALMEVGDRCTEGQMHDIIGYAMHEYACQQCEIQKGQCADEARLLLHDGRTKKDKTLSSKIYMIGADHLKVSQQSILTAKNVCDAK